MNDIKIGCIQCGREFVFTASEQRQYRDRHFSRPRRCPECRKEGDNVQSADRGDYAIGHESPEGYGKG